MRYTVNVEERRTGRIVVEADSHGQAAELVEALIVDDEIEPDRIEWNQDEPDLVVVGTGE